MKKSTLFLLFLTVFSFQKNFAQCLLERIPLNNQVNSSTVIVEGKVIAKTSYWDTRHFNIYTVNRVEVYKVFKGAYVEEINVITPGGTIGTDAEVVTPSLQLDIEDKGVFMLFEDNMLLDAPHALAQKFKPYSGPQGYYKYNVIDNLVINPFHVEEGIANFYQSVIQLTGIDPIEVRPFAFNRTANRSQEDNQAIAIVTFSPTTVTAGTKTILTINGTDFGTTPQNVGFRNSDDGGSSYVFALASQILTWTDTQITVEVPSKAGTGTIAIINSAGDTILASSSSSLAVDYAQLNATYDAGSGDYAYQTQHINDDGSGGYVWQMFTDFDSNTAAKESFIRAFDSWRCETAINWTIGATTTNDVVASDGINIIRFDNGAELPDGVLGRCTSRYSGCIVGGTDLQWYVSELDINFNDTTNWQYGPTLANGAQIDFETVAVHELGHGHQLAHVINSSAIMNYSLGFGVNKRVLSSNDIACAGDIQSRSNSFTPCGQPSMVDFDCSTLSINESNLAEAISVYPNPATNELFIKKLNNSIALDRIEIYSVTGKMVYSEIVEESVLEQKLDLRTFSKGVYFLSISSGINNTVKKIVIN